MSFAVHFEMKSDVILWKPPKLLQPLQCHNKTDFKTRVLQGISEWWINDTQYFQ